MIFDGKNAWIGINISEDEHKWSESAPSKDILSIPGSFTKILPLFLPLSSKTPTFWLEKSASGHILQDPPCTSSVSSTISWIWRSLGLIRSWEWHNRRSIASQWLGYRVEEEDICTGSTQKRLESVLCQIHTEEASWRCSHGPDGGSADEGCPWSCLEWCLSPLDRD